MSEPSSVSEETARRIAERIADMQHVVRWHAAAAEPDPLDPWPLGPILPKNRPRGPYEPPDTRTVYFVEAGALTKIGVTNNLAGRLSDMQTHNGVPLHVVHTYQGGRHLEWALHQEFAADRQRGEWFTLPEDWRERADEIHARVSKNRRYRKDRG